MRKGIKGMSCRARLLVLLNVLSITLSIVTWNKE